MLHPLNSDSFCLRALLLGGGYVILPLLTSELVEKKKWITSDELCEYFALSSSLPGIIAANTAIFTGRKLAGTKGAIAAITGVTMPAFFAITLLASILHKLVHIKTVEYAFWGVSIGVITLLFLAVKEMWGKCIFDNYTKFIYALCLILALLGKISPAIIITIAIIIAILYQKFILNKQEKGEKND